MQDMIANNIIINSNQKMKQISVVSFPIFFKSGRQKAR